MCLNIIGIPMSSPQGCSGMEAVNGSNRLWSLSVQENGRIDAENNCQLVVIQ